PTQLKQQIAGDVITLSLQDHAGMLPRAQELLHMQSFVRDIQGSERALQVYVERGEESLATTLRLLDNAGIDVQTVALARPSLDDVFLRKTGRSLREPVGNGYAR
ncbi:MAG: DUF4162 domain-containing protein, partial [Ktedonobacteraceae bacterium]